MQLNAYATSGSSPGLRPDLLVSDHGSDYLLCPTTSAGSAWIEQHLPADATWFAGAVAVEHLYIGQIVRGAVSDGLSVR